MANAPKKTAPALPTSLSVSASSVVARLLLRRRLVLPLLVATSLAKLFHLLLVRLPLLVRLHDQHRDVRHSVR